MKANDLFETLVTEHYETLFRFAMSLTQMESDACDLTQQTFYVWATKGHQLRDVSKAKTWLFTTLHRLFLNTREKQGRFCHYESEEASPQLPVFSPNQADHLDSADVLAALGKVDEVYQAAVALFYLEDYAYKEIAAILDVPIGTVKSRIARGITQLRKFLLSDECGDSSKHSQEVPSAADAGRAIALTGATASTANNDVKNTTDEFEGYEEWDLSAIHLPEQFRTA